LAHPENPIQQDDDALYIGMALDKRPTSSKYTDQVKKNAAQRLGVLGSFPNRRSGLPIRNGVLLYKQLINSMINYACPIWRSAARSYI
jgi:hypothetical protein